MRRILLLAAAVLLPGSLLRAQDAGTPPPSPPAAPAGPALEPLLRAEADRLLQRAENNLILHGLSLQGRYLRRALGDYRTVAALMPAEFPATSRFVVHFGVAFCIARAEFPEDPAERGDLGAEAERAMDAATALDRSFPGLWIVSGMLEEKKGVDPRLAVEQITRGFADLEGYPGLARWQAYQLRFFGLLSRCRLLLSPKVNREQVALEDAKAALAMAEEAARDPATPRDNRLRVVVLTHVATAEQHLDYFAEAEAVLGTLMKEDPDDYLHPYNLALVLAQQQKYARALECYRRAAALNRTDFRPHLKIAFILLVLPPGGTPDPEGAEREAEILLSLTGRESDEYCSLRGEAAWVRGRMKEAEEWFRKALEDNPNCRHSLERMVRILGAEEPAMEKRREEMEAFKKRLEQETRKRSPEGKGMEVPRTDLTFC